MPPRKRQKAPEKDNPSKSKVAKAVDSDSQQTTEKPKGSSGCTHWLFKSEPDSRFVNGIDVKFGIDDLIEEPDQTACWDGVRSYQARNFMRDEMRIGHKAFFYHSNCKQPGIVGIVEVVKESYVDYTQFDKADPHYDSKAKKEDPRWFMVDIRFIRKLNRYIPLTELKSLHESHKKDGGPLKNMALFTRARLSVQPVSKEEFEYIVKLEDESP